MNARATLFAIGLVVLAPRALRADEGTTDVLVAEAQALEQTGDLAGATKKLEDAFRSGERPDVAGRLGLLEAKSGRFAESAQHLELAMRFFPEKGRAEDRQKLIETFTDVRGKVAAIRFRVKPDADRVTIDGKTPTLTTLDYDVFVMPGQRRVVVPGGKTVTIDAVANGSYPIEVSSIPKRSEAVHEAPRVSARPAWPIVVGGLFAAGGLGVGIGATVVSQAKEKDAKSIAKSAACTGAGPTAGCLADGYRATGDHNTFQALGIAGFVGGGAVLVSTIAYALWPETRTAKRERDANSASCVDLDRRSAAAPPGPTCHPELRSADWRERFVLSPVAGPKLGGLAFEGSF